MVGSVMLVFVFVVVGIDLFDVGVVRQVDGVRKDKRYSQIILL